MEQKTECCGKNEEKEEDGMPLRQIVLAAGVFVLAVVFSHVPVFQDGSDLLTKNTAAKTVVPVLRIGFYLVSYLICGLSVVKQAVWNLLHGSIFDEKFLMSLASIGAVCIGEYPEAVAVMLFYQIGEYFQDYAVGKSHRSIDALMKLRPDKAFILKDGKTQQVQPESVQPGETILVKPGERIPLDGIITKGTSFVDTSAQTGESVPREVFEGAEVLAGFVNTQGVLEIQVTKPYGESSVVRILELVENASRNKAKSEQFITRFARIYTPAVCIAAALLTVLPPLFTHTDWLFWLKRSLIFLVVSCPCALVISVPLSFFGGIGAASRKGILIKGSSYLEKLAHTVTAVFDKTGTLTKGNFIVTAIHPLDKAKVSADDLIAIATHAETYSDHPISKSLKLAHHGACCEKAVVTDAEEISGQGLRVQVDGQTVLAGNLTLMKNQGVQGYIPCTLDDTGTIVHVAIDGAYAGHIVISDELKDDAAAAIASIKKLGVKHTVMLTGDNKDTAEKTAAALGIDTVYSQLLPQDKVTRLEEVIARKKSPQDVVAYVGDGINDAPVLARADVGIAMSALGSDAAMEAADVVIMTDEPSKLAEAVRIARRTMRIVTQNIVFALGVKVLIMVLGALGLANMWFAVFGDVGVTFIAVLNAMRLLIK